MPGMPRLDSLVRIVMPGKIIEQKDDRVERPGSGRPRLSIFPPLFGLRPADVGGNEVTRRCELIVGSQGGPQL